MGTEELNYRRFFSINELISLRVEEEAVFDHTHALILELGQSTNQVSLRIDHIDGLYDPYRYLKRLREQLPESLVVVEKILEFPEELPASWPVQGTTGYDFLNVAAGVFCSRRNRLSFNRIYRRFAGKEVSFPRLVYEKKRLFAEKHMVGDIDNLAHLLKRLAGGYRYGSDFTLYGFKQALGEVLSWFPVYRSYISSDQLGEADLAVIGEAMRKAREAAPDFVHELEFIDKIFTLRFEGELPPEEQRRWYDFIQRFQQFTGPLMAKGLEDTALYVYNRLLSLNEVGANPDKFGTSAIEFHHFNRRRALAWPHTMNATSTHDTKRGEDLRARLNVLSEIPMEWDHQVGLWRRLNRRHKVAGSREVPDPNDEYLLYQTLLGAWPFREDELPHLRQRIKEYLIKAVREAKVHTAWLAPDQGYEEGFLTFVDRVLEPTRAEDRLEAANPFLGHFRPFQRRVAWYGILNSLSQTLLKMTCPGIPDFYQGSELWDLNLVDPDNRRPVDYALRETLLSRLDEEAAADLPVLIEGLLAAPEDGRIKLFLVWKALTARAREAELFARGTYVPLEVRGERRRNLIAFARVAGGRWAVAAVPRFFTELAPEGRPPLGRGVWGDTSIRVPSPFGKSIDALTGCPVAGSATLLARDLFARFPGALLLPAAS